MIALPAPQKSTISMVLSARWEAPLTASPGGPVYDFGALVPQTVVNVSSGFLYRILSYSFSTEIPESDYASALIPGNPLSFQLRGSWNHTDVLAKPVPLPMYQRDAKFLQYFTVTEDQVQLTARLQGQLSGAAVGLIGFPSIVAILSMFVQCISDDEWLTKYERGEM